MVLIALAIVFAGLGAMSLSKSDTSADTAHAASTTTTTTNSSTSAQPAASVVTQSPTTAPTTTAGGVDKSTPVRVLNNSTIAGLAARTSSRLSANGWNVVATGNYANRDLPRTTVYYENSREEATAQAIAELLGGVAQPRSSALAESASGIIVIVTGS